MIAILVKLLLFLLFLACFFVILLCIVALPYPYQFFAFGAIVLGCLYWIFRIITNPKLTRAEKWDRLLGRTL